MDQKLLVTLRVKNAIIFINDWLSCYGEIADGIVVVDNGSDDGTWEILRNHPKVIEIVRSEGFDEGRDFQILLDLVRKHSADWILTVDADEIFERSFTRKHIRKLIASKTIKHYKFRRYHLFKDSEHYIANKEIVKCYYHNFGDRSLYRNTEQLFVSPEKIHTTIFGRPKLFIQSSFRILHLPFLHYEYRLKAYQKYIQIDSNSRNQEVYKRDINMLENPDEVIVNKFHDRGFISYLEFIKYNIQTVLYKIYSLKKR